MCFLYRNNNNEKPWNTCLTYCLSECVLLIFLLLLDERKDTSPSDLKLEDNISKTLSVTEAMTTTADEKTKKSEKSTDDSSDEQENIVQGQIETDTAQEASVDGQSEHVESKMTSEDFVKVFFICVFTIVQNNEKCNEKFCKEICTWYLKCVKLCL